MKRTIGIDINSDKIRMIQLRLKRGKFRLEQSCVREIPKSDPSEEKFATDIQALISRIIAEENFDVRARVTVTTPANRVFFCNFRTDLSRNEDVQQLLKFELEDDFPIPFDELVAGICGSRILKGDDREFLIGVLSRLELQKWVNTANGAGLECSTVTTDVCALRAVVSLNHNMAGMSHSMILHVDDCRIILAISEKDELVCIRHLNYQDFVLTGDNSHRISALTLTREIELTWRTLYRSNIPPEFKVFINGNNELFHDLSQTLQEAINCEVVALNPFAQINCSEQHQTGFDVAIAVGSSLIGANKSKEVLDFLAIDEVKSDQTAEMKRSLLIFALLFLAIGILLVANFFFKLNTLEKKHQSMKQEIRKIFMQTLPEEKRIVNELAQMTERLEALQAEYGTLTTEVSNTISPLNILQYISEKITPDQDIGISNISITTESVRLIGTATSFKSVDDLTSVLHQVSEFSTVELQNIDVNPKSGVVRFSLLITMELK